MNFALAHSNCGKISRSVRSEAPRRPPRAVFLFGRYAHWAKLRTQFGERPDHG
jgi:hypothetical protein